MSRPWSGGCPWAASRTTRTGGTPPAVSAPRKAGFGDPVGEAVAIRDREEGLGGTLTAKVRSALTYYREIAASGVIVAAHYMDSFERVWETAKPWHGEET
jgi:hypothetical protein